MKYELFDLKYI